MWWSPHDRDEYTMVFISLSLALQILLGISILLHLFKRRSRMRDNFVQVEINHHSPLSVGFIESAGMNIICSIFLLMASLPTTPSHGDWKNFAWKSYKVFLVVTPAVQVCVSHFRVHNQTRLRLLSRHALVT